MAMVAVDIDTIEIYRVERSGDGETRAEEIKLEKKNVGKFLICVMKEKSESREIRVIIRNIEILIKNL